MRYGSVPHLDTPIARMVLGSVPFTTAELENTFSLLDAYTAAGGNTIDLSHVYRSGDCHRALGQYVEARGCRDSLVLFDKGCHHYGGIRRVTRGGDGLRYSRQPRKPGRDDDGVLRPTPR